MIPPTLGAHVLERLRRMSEGARRIAASPVSPDHAAHYTALAETIEAAAKETEKGEVFATVAAMLTVVFQRGLMSMDGPRGVMEFSMMSHAAVDELLGAELPQENN